jgi:hypothetical protein
MSAVFIAVFDREEDLVSAARAARKQNVQVVDAFTPYAIHGLAPALGLAPTRLPWVCFLLGLTGLASILGFQYWASATDWPINVGGKPWNSLPAFIPATFEMTVLFAGVGTVVAFLWIAGLRPGRAPNISGLRVTDDRFALVMRGSRQHDRRSLESLLAPFHPVAIEERAGETA